MFATVATPAIVTVKARAAIERLGSLLPESRDREMVADHQGGMNQLVATI
jgi:hypothetical protein